MKNRAIAIIAMFWVLGGFPVLAAQAADYKLAMSTEKDVCRLMLAFANDNFHDKGLSSFMQLGNLPTLEASEFELVRWGTEGVIGASSEVPIKSSVVDINNDGQLDWVLKTQWMLSSQYSEQLDIFANHQEPVGFEGGLDNSDLDRADHHLSLTGQSYTLKKISPHKFKDGATRDYWIGGVFKLVLFRFRNITYILMVTPGAAPEVMPGRRKFSAVVKYTPAFTLQDVCYIEELQGKRK
ncbi:MAG: hypothetical protein WCH20_05645 [Nitrospira sp.]|jgi:hypothetical protein